MFERHAGSQSVAAVAIAGLLGIIGLPGLDGGGANDSGAPSARQWHEMGRTHAPDGVLRRSCHQYKYRYRVDPPSNDWSLETFLRGPGGQALASDVILSGADPRKGTKRFRICKPNTRPGRFTIRAKLSYDSYPDTYAGWLRPSHFRLRR